MVCRQINGSQQDCQVFLRVMNYTRQKAFVNCSFGNTSPPTQFKLGSAGQCFFLNFEPSEVFRNHSVILIKSCKLVYTNWCVAGTHASLLYLISLHSSCGMNLDFYKSTVLASALKWSSKMWEAPFNWRYSVITNCLVYFWSSDDLFHVFKLRTTTRGPVRKVKKSLSPLSFFNLTIQSDLI